MSYERCSEMDGDENCSRPAQFLMMPVYALGVDLLDADHERLPRPCEDHLSSAIRDHDGYVVMVFDG